MAEAAPPSRQDYPLYGYVYNERGYHPGPVQLNSEAQAARFLELIARPAIALKREVMLTDVDDFCVFHAKDGEILFPTQAEVDQWQREQSRS